MNTKSNARDRHPPVFILMFLALVLFAVGWSIDWSLGGAS
jgi:hypothetical protein